MRREDEIILRLDIGFKERDFVREQYAKVHDALIDTPNGDRYYENRRATLRMWEARLSRVEAYIEALEWVLGKKRFDLDE